MNSEGVIAHGDPDELRKLGFTTPLTEQEAEFVLQFPADERQSRLELMRARRILEEQEEHRRASVRRGMYGALVAMGASLAAMPRRAGRRVREAVERIPRREKYPGQSKAYLVGAWGGDGVAGSMSTKRDRDRRRDLRRQQQLQERGRPERDLALTPGPGSR